MAEPAEFNCCSCKSSFADKSEVTKVSPGDDNPRYRCKKCNNSSANASRRIKRTLQQRDSIADVWDEVPKGTKEKFRREARSLTGEDIEMKMRTIVTEQKKATFESSFLGEGKFFDQATIEEDYKDRPQQKAAIYQHGLKMWHPDRQCNVWRIREFTMAELEKFSHEKILKREGVGVDTCKKPKVQKKPSGQAEASKPEEAELKDLSDGQKIAFGKQKVKLIASCKKVEEKCEAVKALAGNTTEHVDAATIQIAEANLLEAELTMMLEAGRAQDAKGVTKRVTEMMNKLTKHREVLDLHKKLAAATKEVSAAHKVST